MKSSTCNNPLASSTTSRSSATPLQCSLWALLGAIGWNHNLNTKLLTLGLTHCMDEHGMYTRGGGAERLIMGIYVDDLIITGGDANALEGFKE